MKHSHLWEKNKNAFTLAEVLITLGIIGVVAAMTIPTLIQNYNQRAWDTAASVFNRRLGEALGFMNTQSSLVGFATTKDFVNELSRHIKITKICNNNELTDCFTSEIFTTGETINTPELKLARNLNSAGNYGTETVGVQFADGVTALVAYNPNATQDPYSNQVIKFTGSDKSVGLGTDAIAILYDVSGGKNPNSYGTGKDIRGINIALKIGAEFLNLGTNYLPVDCSFAAGSSTDETIKSNFEKYCGDKDYYISDFSEDYWAGAQKVCEDNGMHLPSSEEFQELYERKGEDGIPTSGWYWTDSTFDCDYAWLFDFENGEIYNSGRSIDEFNVICLP